jgi:pyridoxamine 5'-phosphate oxidase
MVLILSSQPLYCISSLIQITPRQPGMMLCTASTAGEPSARIVLLRQFDKRGFVFYTNYNSRKGQQILANPNVAATFWWHESSVRIEGTAEKVCARVSFWYTTE